MSKSHKNPYRVKSNYGQIFAWMQKTRIFTLNAVAAEFAKLGSKNPEASATVLCGPTETGLGNFSARGDVYFCRRMKREKGSERKMMLCWRKEPMIRKIFDRENGKVVSVDMAKKSEEKAAKKLAAANKPAKVKVVAKKSVKKATKKPAVKVAAVKTVATPKVEPVSELAAKIRASAPAAATVAVEAAPAVVEAPVPPTVVETPTQS